MQSTMEEEISQLFLIISMNRLLHHTVFFPLEMTAERLMSIVYLLTSTICHLPSIFYHLSSIV